MKFRLPSLTRFSLRTLFVLVTLLALGLGYFGQQHQIVRERREAIAVLDRIHNLEFENTHQEFVLIAWPTDYNIPWVRRALGENRARWIKFGHRFTPEELTCLKRSFPEASFTTVNAPL